MSTTVIDTLSWCKHNVFASSMMQIQCICIIMTILESSSLMFTTSIQVYNTMSFVFVHRSRWHTLCFQVHWSSRVAGPAERPGIHKVHGLPSPAPTLESALVRLWSYQWAQLQHPSWFSTKRSTPGGRVNTKSSPLVHGPVYLGTASIEDSDVPCEQCDQFKKNGHYWWQNNVFVLDIINCYVSLIHIMWFEYIVITYYVILICYYYVLCNA